jgi:limonene-1,2-epoxide hydrolase
LGKLPGADRRLALIAAHRAKTAAQMTNRKLRGPSEIVLAFVAAWNANDMQRIFALLHQDVVYHNIPMTPLVGLPAVRSYLQGKGGFDWINWQLLAIAESGNKVLTERVDDFSINGVDVSLPVMGIFEVQDELIHAWRDYFDLATYQKQLAKSPR